MPEGRRRRWRSERLQRDVTLVRWGTFGQPVLVFPTAGGDAEEIERLHLIDVLQPLLEAGQDQGLLAATASRARRWSRRRARRRTGCGCTHQFHQYVRHEVVPAIRTDCHDRGHRHHDRRRVDRRVPRGGRGVPLPERLHARALRDRGTYDLRAFFDAGRLRPTTSSSSSPLHFVPTLGPGPHLDVLRTRFILLAVGRGPRRGHRRILARWPTCSAPRASRTASTPGARDWHHDWLTWREMLPKYLGEWA